MVKGKGSAVGSALDNIAKTKEESYLLQSLIGPNAVLAESYTVTPMPPMNRILNPQELADVLEYLKSLK